jgi:alpha-ketoglutarate-dependent taurine dioxygenase
MLTEITSRLQPCATRWKLRALKDIRSSIMSVAEDLTVDTPSIFGRFTGRDAWTGASLRADEGTITLSPECLLEIRDTLSVLRANPLPVLTLGPDDVEMPACAAVMATARRELDEGLGFAIIDRLPLDEMSTEEVMAIYWLLARMTGRPVAQKWMDGRMLYSVTDLGRPSGNGVRPDVTNEDQSFHTDNSYNLCPPDHVGLLCLRPAMEGGISRVVSMTAVHNRMDAEFPDLIDRLYQPFFFDRQREHAEGDAMTIHRPVLAAEEGRLRVRVSRNLMYQGYRLAGKPVDQRSEDALAAWFSIVDDPAMYKEFFFEPGQIQFVNNRIMGHKRTKFTDWPDPARKRHLLRVWLRERGPRFYNG